MIVLEICGPFNVLDFQRNKHTSIPLVSRNLAYLTKCSLNIFKIKLTYESESEVSQSCPTLCNPMDCSLPGSSIHGIFQA